MTTTADSSAFANDPPSDVRAARVSGQVAAEDVLGPVLGVGKSGVRVGATVGILLAAMLHGYMAVRVYSALYGIEGWIRESRKEMHQFLQAYGPEIDTRRIPEEKKEPAKEEKPVAPEVKEEVAEPEQKPVVQHQPRPVATQAQPPPDTQPKRDIYQDENPGGGGETSLADYSSTGIYDPAGSGGGKGGGHGTGIGNGKGPGIGNVPPAPPPPKVEVEIKNLSKPAELVGSKSWNCPFPPEADAEGRDKATVKLVVTVGLDGTPERVSVLADPGSGFGRAARSCALGRRYKAGLDREGKPTRTSTAPITVNFTR